ncbi:serine protease [Mucilaginibacter litoreus]|uniref:Serine protease n=1 Tax=Mucilaginibacter litoreus TaxID=1048221 RepID=A0ABW3AR02_9SPHI
MRKLNNIPQDNLGYAVLLSLNHGESFGSGFRLKYQNSNYLVTARHVLYNDDFKLRSDFLTVTCQSARAFDLDPLIMEIELDKAKVHYSASNDVAILLIGTNQLESKAKVPLKNDKAVHKRVAFLQLEKYVNITSTGNKFVTSVDSEATRKLDEIRVGNDIFLLGYPMSLRLKEERFFDYSKPLLRKGITAATYPKENTFTVDCPAYFGNSGGPVIEHGEDDYYRVIGIVSRYIPYIVEWVNPREHIVNKEYTNSGYSICVPMDAVYALIDKHKP